MIRRTTALIAWAALTAGTLPAADFPRFKTQEIAADLTIGYAVIAADINGDGKPDIVVVDKHRVVWYENPTWKVRTILQGKTKPDNVCITALDVDGDGQLDLVLGAGWKPFDTQTPGTLQWLKRGMSLDDEWTLYPIKCDEPTVHRVRVADVLGEGKPQLILAPLMGRDATAKGNWMDGRPVRILAYPVPKEPTKAENWKPVVISEELHVVHNFVTEGTAVRLPDEKPDEKVGGFDIYPGTIVTAASYEGLTLVRRSKIGKLTTYKIGEGFQKEPKTNRGSSEVAWGHAQGVRFLGGDFAGGMQLQFTFVSAIEPWHGNQVVVYEPAPNGRGPLWKRTVIDDHLRWGHAIKCVYLGPPLTEAGVEYDDIIAGVRDDPNPKAGDTFTERRGVRVYRRNKDGKWDRFILDDGGIAVEDLVVADLNGDGKPDIIAVGRATGNCRVYWNEGK